MMNNQEVESWRIRAHIA